MEFTEWQQHLKEADPETSYFEKICSAHRWTEETPQKSTSQRSTPTQRLRIDHIGLQDASGPMALIQFFATEKSKRILSGSIHCDHQARVDGSTLETQPVESIFEFLETAAADLNYDFWPAGSGIIHSQLCENYVEPGMFLIATDSHTNTVGALGALSKAVGGGHAALSMTEGYCHFPDTPPVAVRLCGEKPSFASGKDIAFAILHRVGLNGLKNQVVEFTGDWSQLSIGERMTISNMSTEMGARAALFPADEKTLHYLNQQHRSDAANRIEKMGIAYFQAGKESQSHPERHYASVMEIDLSTVTPMIAGPARPDKIWSIGTIDQLKGTLKKATIDQVLIGSCTNSSLEDLHEVCEVIKEHKSKPFKVPVLITPGTKTIASNLETLGYTALIEAAGGKILPSACGPCANLWKHEIDRPQLLVTTFNRNFPGRTDGNKETEVLLASPRLAAQLAYKGEIDRLSNYLSNESTENSFSEPSQMRGSQTPETPGQNKRSVRDFQSEKIQPLPQPMERPLQGKFHWLGYVADNCSTDEISPAGPWISYRGHLEKISENFLSGVTVENRSESGVLWSPVTQKFETSLQVLRAMKKESMAWGLIAGENYGIGSSREHAALSGKFWGCRFVAAKSFAEIHYENLVFHGVLPLFHNLSVGDFPVNTPIQMDLHQLNSENELFPIEINGEIVEMRHRLNQRDIQWILQGGALS